MAEPKKKMGLEDMADVSKLSIEETFPDYYKSQQVQPIQQEQRDIPWWKKAVWFTPAVAPIAAAVDPEIGRGVAGTAAGIAKGVGKAFGGVGKLVSEAARAAGAEDLANKWQEGANEIGRSWSENVESKYGKAPVAEFVGEQLPYLIPGAGIAGRVGGGVAKAASAAALEGAIQGAVSPSDKTGSDYWKGQAAASALGAGLGGALGGGAAAIVNKLPQRTLGAVVRKSYGATPEEIAAARKLLETTEGYGASADKLLKAANEAAIDETVPLIQNAIQTHRDLLEAKNLGLDLEKALKNNKDLDFSIMTKAEIADYVEGLKNTKFNTDALELGDIKKFNPIKDTSGAEMSITQMLRPKSLPGRWLEGSMNIVEPANGIYSKQQERMIKSLDDLIAAGDFNTAEAYGKGVEAFKKRVKGDFDTKYSILGAVSGETGFIPDSDKEPLVKALVKAHKEAEGNRKLKDYLMSKLEDIANINTYKGLDSFRQGVGRDMIDQGVYLDEATKGSLYRAADDVLKSRIDRIQEDIAKSGVGEFPKGANFQELKNAYKSDVIDRFGDYRRYDKYISPEAGFEVEAMDKLLAQAKTNPAVFAKDVDAAGPAAKTALKKRFFEQIDEKFINRDTNHFNLAGAVRHIESMEGATKSLFNDVELKELENIRRTWSALRSSQDYNFIPNNGARANVSLLIGSAIGSPIKALAGITIGRQLKKYLDSPNGKRAVLGILSEAMGNKALSSEAISRLRSLQNAIINIPVGNDRRLKDVLNAD